MTRPEDAIISDQREHVTDSDTGLGKWYLIGAAVMMLVLLPFVLVEGPGAGILNRLGWTDRDPSFTELYFPDHLALPNVIAHDAPLEFDFSIRNREGTSTTYSWRVILGPEPTSAGGEVASATVAQGEERLGNDEAAVVRVERLVRFSSESAVVSVVLVGRDEAIHFPITIGSGEHNPPD